MLRHRLASLTIIAIAVACLSGCAPSGDGTAASLAERVIIGIGDDITPPYPSPHEADYLAAPAVRNPRLPPSPQAYYSVRALSWEGNSGDEKRARIVIRVAVHVPAQDGPSYYGPSQPEGRATRCWQLTVFGYHDYDSLQLDEISCPTGPAPAAPTPAPLPSFAADAGTTLESAITGATARDIDDRVRLAFPDDYYSIASDTLNDEVAVAVGIPTERTCMLGVIHADGTVQIWDSVSGVQLLPGETGCSPELYFHPIVTH